MPRATSEKYGLVLFGITRPMVPVVWQRSERASALGT
jgi:hypothetical protein